jgi:hypothetical protein
LASAGIPGREPEVVSISAFDFKTDCKMKIQLTACAVARLSGGLFPAMLNCWRDAAKPQYRQFLKMLT